MTPREAREEIEKLEEWSLLRDKIEDKRQNFCATFKHDGKLEGPGYAVLKDLAKYCRANASCWDADPRKHAALEGRREVWLRIQEYLTLSADELARLYIAIKPGE